MDDPETVWRHKFRQHLKGPIMLKNWAASVVLALGIGRIALGGLVSLGGSQWNTSVGSPSNGGTNVGSASFDWANTTLSGGSNVVQANTGFINPEENPNNRVNPLYDLSFQSQQTITFNPIKNPDGVTFKYGFNGAAPNGDTQERLTIELLDKPDGTGTIDFFALDTDVTGISQVYGIKRPTDTSGDTTVTVPITSLAAVYNKPLYVRIRWQDGDLEGNGEFARFDEISGSGVAFDAPVTTEPIPEPSSMLLLAIGAIGIWRFRRLRG